LVRVRGL